MIPDSARERVQSPAASWSARWAFGAAFAVALPATMGCADPVPDPANPSGSSSQMTTVQPPKGEAAHTPTAGPGDTGPADSGSVPADAAQDGGPVGIGATDPDAAGDVAAPDAASDSPDAPLDAPISLFCGDGIRDPATEECDDGLDGDAGVDARACTGECVALDRLVELEPGILERRLGTGRHPVAAGALGFAVASVEVPEPGSAKGPRISVATFWPNGARRGVAHVDEALYGAGPVVASLPDGSFALAWTSPGVDGDGLGIALARIPAAGGAVGTIAHANAATAFGQHSPDIVASGGGFVLAWEDDSPLTGRTVCRRRFDDKLAPLGGESCEAPSAATQSRVVLAGVGNDVARAWREENDGSASLVVKLGASSWTFPLTGLPGSEESAAMAAIGPERFALAHSDGEGALWAAVLHVNGATSYGPVQLNPAPSEPRHRPAIAVSADGIYLAWKEPAPPPDPGWGWMPLYDETWMQKLVWDGATLTAAGPALSLPHDDAHRVGDQAAPALASAPLGPYGALVAAWEDLTSTNYAGEPAHGDVAVELIPTPVVRKWVAK